MNLCTRQSNSIKFSCISFYTGTMQLSFWLNALQTAFAFRLFLRKRTPALRKKPLQRSGPFGIWKPIVYFLCRLTVASKLAFSIPSLKPAGAKQTLRPGCNGCQLLRCRPSYAWIQQNMKRFRNHLRRLINIGKGSFRGPSESRDGCASSRSGLKRKRARQDSVLPVTSVS